MVTNRTVLLRGHYRASEESVHLVLDHIRCANVTPEDIALLRSRVFGYPGGPNPEDEEWRSTVLVTTRNVVRQAWNNLAALRHALDNSKQIFISPSYDEGINCDRQKMIWTADSKTGFLATWNVLCIDAPAIVTANIAVELGVANRTEAIIGQVIPDPRDSCGWSRLRNQVVKLTRPPICVSVELTQDKHLLPERLGGANSHFPIMAITEKLPCPKEFACREKEFWRTQQPLTLGFSLSDHKV